ncbi:hypothetical protein JS84_24840 [Vibrio vulnificus]|uniref:hypothetical protein n=1 Tax=Vibrio vulnificus TaxID=672 RepID=UPI0005074D1D|nr:hypothetical protein [Vibrio vulnificus]KFK60828.1 hypothetical protein JS84_24840 [Vibrio vulnificus]
MSFYPLVQLRRAASQHSFNRPVFSCSVHVTEGIAEILEQCEYLREINGSDIDGNLVNFNDYIDQEIEVYLSGEHRTPIVLSVSISENLLSKDINFSLLNELTSAESELNMHYSDKLSVFYASLHEFLGGGYAPDEAFNKLIDSWGAFVALYQNNLSTYLSGFSFHKAKKEVAEAGKRVS